MNTINEMLQAQASGVDILAAGGLIDWVEEKSNSAQSALRVFASLGGIIFVIIQAFSSRGSMGRIIVSGIAAGVFVFIIFNVTSLGDRVKQEVNSAPPAAATVIKT